MQEIDLSYVGELEEALQQAVRDGISEDVLARAFVAAYGARLRFDQTRGQWFEYDGDTWRIDDLRRAFEYARRVCRNHGKGAKFHKASVAAGVEKFASADPLLSCRSADWDPDPMMLGTPGGTVDLSTGKLKPSDPSNMISRCTSVAPTSEGREKWLGFLSEATGGDTEFISFLQRVAGYALTGLTREHALFFIHGPGGNGKGVFLHTITRILGSYAMSTPMETFTASRNDRHPVELAVLQGARLVTASETEQGRSWAESRIKQLTGGDPIPARFMYRPPFEYMPQFKIVITGNHEPMLRNVDDAARRRFNIIPFRHKPARVDKLLEHRLEEEHGAILQWAIEGCLDYQRVGLDPPAIVTQQTARYFEEQDVMGQWLAERCEMHPSYFETADLLYESYQRFASHAGERAMSKKAFGSALRDRFADGRSSGRNRDRGYHGLRLLLLEGTAESRTANDAHDDEELRRP
jgi:putative DNA primase/helicase